MSDFMFMLESHLSPEQNQVVSMVESAAAQAGVNVFLTGGALRDMMGGFPIRDLDFTVEGHPAKLVKILTGKHAARVARADTNRKATDLVFPGSVACEVSMACQAEYARPAATPVIKPAAIYDDLRGRDFTMNSIALSLSKASRGLLMDPTNGQGDLARRELRANSNYTLYDDPSRILRLFRFRARMGLELEPRTQSQYENVREAQLEQKIPPRALLAELRAMADEPNIETLIETLDREKLLTLFSPALAGSKLNLAGFAKLQKARQLIPFGVEFPSSNIGLFLFVLTEKLSPREKSHLIQSLGMHKADVDAWQKLEGRARKAERALKSARLNKASLVYQALRETPGEQVLFLLMRTSQRLVHDRIKNHLQRYLTVAQEDVSDKDPVLVGLEPGTPKFRKAKDELIFAHLDGRIRKPAPEPAPPPEPARAAGRGGFGARR